MGTPKNINIAVKSTDVTSRVNKYSIVANVVVKAIDAAINANTNTSNTEYNTISVNGNTVYSNKGFLNEMLIKFNNSFSGVDRLKLQITRNLFNSTTTADICKLYNSIRKSDTISCSDTIKKNSSKIIIDTSSIIEILKKNNHLVYTDAILSGDSTSINLNANGNIDLNSIDTNSQIDAFVINIDKHVNDSLVLLEEVRYILSLNRSDTFTSIDFVKNIFNLNHNNTINVNDSAIITINDYCDDQYVETDYVSAIISITN